MLLAFYFMKYYERMLVESIFKSKFFTPKFHNKWLIYDCVFSALYYFKGLILISPRNLIFLLWFISHDQHM